jgi:trk system potassium uptake protein TrkA
LKDLREKVPFTVILIKRRGEYIIPKGDTVVKLGDTIYIAVEDKDVEELKKLLKFEKDRVRDVFVFGYSKYSDRFLERLNRRGDVRVKFFHPDYEICDELSKKYKNVFVFQGDPTDEELLRAEGIERADYVFCLGEGEESDIVLAVFANNLGAKRTCVLIKHPQFEKIIETLKVHSYVLPKKIVASYIYSYLREENIAEVTELEEGVDIYKILYEGEEKPVQNLKLKNCDLIIAVERDGKTFIPKGTTLIQKGDYLYCLRKM